MSRRKTDLKPVKIPATLIPVLSAIDSTPSSGGASTAAAAAAAANSQTATARSAKTTARGAAPPPTASVGAGSVGFVGGSGPEDLEFLAAALAPPPKSAAAPPAPTLASANTSAAAAAAAAVAISSGGGSSDAAASLKPIVRTPELVLQLVTAIHAQLSRTSAMQIDWQQIGSRLNIKPVYVFATALFYRSADVLMY